MPEAPIYENSYAASTKYDVWQRSSDLSVHAIPDAAPPNCLSKHQLTRSIATPHGTHSRGGLSRWRSIGALTSFSGSCHGPIP
jgi:hypothetical protein